MELGEKRPGTATYLLRGTSCVGEPQVKRRSFREVTV